MGNLVRLAPHLSLYNLSKLQQQTPQEDYADLNADTVDHDGLVLESQESLREPPETPGQTAPS